MPTPPASLETADGTRDHRVDWLRGAAALMVLLHHALAVPDPVPIPALAPLRAVAHWGYLGVPVFFVLSGRCVGRTWLRGRDAATFGRRRLRRIYPPYLASLVVCAAIIGLRKFSFGINDVAPVPTSLGGIAATLTLATDPVTTVPVMNWVYWSLSYELVFYLLLAGLLFVRPERARLLGWLGLHAGLCGLDALQVGHNHSPLFFVQSWGLFAVGVGLCLHFAGRAEAKPSLAISALHALILGFQGRLDAAALLGGLTVTALLAPVGWWRPGAGNWLARVGEFSYSLYLVHLPIGIYLVQSRLRPLLPPTFPGALLLLAATLAAALGGAWLFYRSVERRFTQPSPAAA